jgi:hypothetical protein
LYHHTSRYHPPKIGTELHQKVKEMHVMAQKKVMEAPKYCMQQLASVNQYSKYGCWEIMFK